MGKSIGMDRKIMIEALVSVGGNSGVNGLISDSSFHLHSRSLLPLFPDYLERV